MNGAERPPGGVVHTYLGYDPVRFGSASQPAPDLVSAAMDRMLLEGPGRRFSEEELANAIRLDPSQLKGLGPSVESLIATLEERKRKILATYDPEPARADAARAADGSLRGATPPKEHEKAFRTAFAANDLRALERLWYRLDERSDFAAALVRLVSALERRYEVDTLASRWHFTGREALSIDRAIEVKEELETIERLLKQLREALKNARPAIVDLDELSRFATEDAVGELRDLQRQANELLRQLAERQGLEATPEGFRVSPKALRTWQSGVLARIFADLSPSGTGRHPQAIAGDGDVELPATRPYEFGDAPSLVDMPQSIVNAALREARQGHAGRLRMRPDDLEIHRTRNHPRCATAVIVDMSGSMRYGGQHVHAKRMALALDGLVRREYPGDFLQFIEMYSLAKLRPPGELLAMMPKPVSIQRPVVRLRADLSDPRIGELDLPLHFTNIQHALRLARTSLAGKPTPNRQVILITDGLPTAHLEGKDLLLLYPPDPRTEEATLREARACAAEGIVINLFLVPSWSQGEEDVRFAHRLAESTRGRVFFTGGRDLDRFVVWDHLARRRSILG
jgi:uncharacterized protein with von Willebrand factor type A (vWA) domain